MARPLLGHLLSDHCSGFVITLRNLKAAFIPLSGSWGWASSPSNNSKTTCSFQNAPCKIHPKGTRCWVPALQGVTHQVTGCRSPVNPDSTQSVGCPHGSTQLLQEWPEGSQRTGCLFFSKPDRKTEVGAGGCHGTTVPMTLNQSGTRGPCGILPAGQSQGFATS